MTRTAAARRPKNHFLSGRCSRFAQRYFDAAARYSSRDRRPDLTCVLSCGRAWFDRIIRDGTTATWVANAKLACDAAAQLLLAPCSCGARIPAVRLLPALSKKRERNDLPLH